jgi:hypothetical protein
VLEGAGPGRGGETQNDGGRRREEQRFHRAIGPMVRCANKAQAWRVSLSNYRFRETGPDHQREVLRSAFVTMAIAAVP